MSEALRTEHPNYKGVMICSRPEETIQPKSSKKFVSRVTPKELLGVNPIRRHLDVVAGRPPVSGPTLTQSYKAWVRGLDEEMQERAQEAVEDEEKGRAFFKRFREKSRRMREQWRVWKQKTRAAEAPQQPGRRQSPVAQLPIDYNSLLREVLASPHPPFDPPAPKPLKNTRKPEWAFSAAQREDREDREALDLIAFMDGLDVQKYKKDVEVRHLLANLKSRFEELHEALSKPDPGSDPRNPQAPVFHSQTRIARAARSDAQDAPAEQKPLPSRDEFGLAVASSQKRIKSGVGVAAQQRQSAKHRPHTAADKQGEGLLTDKLRTLIVKRIADAILRSDAVASGEQKLAQVHSNASLRRMIEGLVSGYLNDNRLVLDRYVSQRHAPADRQPRTVSYAVDRSAHKAHVQGLPYLYPSPLI